MDSEESYVISPSRIEIIPLPEGEVEVEQYRAVFRGDIEIRCRYPDSHRVVLPRRHTVPAIYIMHIPVGYELRRIPPPVPSRYISSVTPFDSSPGSSRVVRQRVEPPRPVPGTPARGPSMGSPAASASRAPVARGVPECQCLACRSVRASRPSPPAIGERGVQEFTPGPSSHRVSGRVPDNGVDIRGPLFGARLSPSPSYSPAPVVPRVGNDVIYISSDEEDPEEDP